MSFDETLDLTAAMFLFISSTKSIAIAHYCYRNSLLLLKVGVAIRFQLVLVGRRGAYSALPSFFSPSFSWNFFLFLFLYPLLLFLVLRLFFLPSVSLRFLAAVFNFLFSFSYLFSSRVLVFAVACFVFEKGQHLLRLKCPAIGVGATIPPEDISAEILR